LPSKFRAAWVLPIAEAPMANATITVADGRVAAVAGAAAPDADPDAIDLGPVAVLPALVNAHTHIELSYLRGAVPPAARFLDWIRPLMAARREYPDPADPRILAAARAAIGEARASGTGLVGDVSNTLVSAPLLEEAGLPAHIFYELLGFNTPDPGARVAEARDRVDSRPHCSLAPHAPYSVSPALFQAIRADIDAHDTISTVHLGESPEEVEFIRRGTGGWKTLLEELGSWSADWKAPGVSPVQYLEDLGFLDSRVLAVHGAQFSGEDLSRLRALNVTLVTCPRSNRHVGVGSPPIEAFYAMEVAVAFGTDSLASADDLNIFGELAEARRLAPRVPARALLESATATGARALGFGDDYGTIEPGKRAALIAVRVPEGIADVEEYLVSGISPDRIAWVS
jgi:cytosine/adenosine deaminase-related metal-dependent hydrolase